jgi:RNA polymerase sigma-70 factor (ECF subfamily)
MTTQQLVSDRAADSEEAAFDAETRMAQLHADHSAELMRYLLGYSRGDHQAAEDMLQETMLRTWSHIRSVPPGTANARRWMFKVARHITIDVARGRRVRPIEVSLVEGGWKHITEDHADGTLAARAVVDAFAGLNTDQQAVLTELHFQGRTVADIAERLGVPKGTVKSRAHYGMHSIRAALLPQY